MKIKIAILLGCFLLSSCAFRQEPSVISNNPAITQATDIKQWQVQGALGANDGKNAFSANVVWAQNPNQFAMTLYGPVGVGTLKVTGAPGLVTLIDSSGKKITASSAEELLKKQTGWTLPVSYLNYWIKGLPVPSIASQSSHDEAKRLAHLQQGGWQVDYLNWSNQAGISLPTKISMTHGNLKIRLVITQWQVR